MLRAFFCYFFINAILILPVSAGASSAELYAENCASCHGADRLGLTGPALLPGNLQRLK
jgi:mono/diheme cytochrome c family protein